MLDNWERALYLAHRACAISNMESNHDVDTVSLPKNEHVLKVVWRIFQSSVNPMIQVRLYAFCQLNQIFLQHCTALQFLHVWRQSRDFIHHNRFYYHCAQVMSVKNFQTATEKFRRKDHQR